MSNISHIFLFDSNCYSISVFSISTRLLSSQFYLYIYDLEEINVTGSTELFIFGYFQSTNGEMV